MKTGDKTTTIQRGPAVFLQSALFFLVFLLLFIRQDVNNHKEYKSKNGNH